MKTIVYQAFSGNKPVWIDRCISTVKEWARANSFDYQFIGDQMLDYVPQWYRNKVGDKIALVADLARLKLAKEYLSYGYERTIWVDADIVIFDTEKFSIDVNCSYAFGREVWCDLASDGRLLCTERVNNGVLVFTGKNRLLLDLYILAFKINIKRIQKNHIPFDVHIRFLTNLYKYIKIPLLTNVGQFSPAVMDSIFNNKVNLLREYMDSFGLPMYASNLCLSCRNRNREGIMINDDMYGKVIDRLMETKGEFLNG